MTRDQDDQGPTFPPEKMEELQGLMASGIEAERILRSPIWAQLFTSIREVYILEVTQAKGERDLLRAQAKLSSLGELQRVLKGVLDRGVAASKEVQNAGEEVPPRDVRPRKRVQ